MDAYLVYASWEGEKNRQFIRMFQEAGRQRGISFTFVPLEEYRTRKQADLVLNRTRLPEVSRWYQERGCAVLHGPSVVEVANDKWKTLLWLLRSLERSGVSAGWEKKWMPDTMYLSPGGLGETRLPCILWQEGRERLVEKLPGDFLAEHPALVIKTLSGHGGAEVAQVSSPGEIRDFLGSFPCAGAILQEEIPCGGRDVRMYVLGNRMYQGILRRGMGDFRSNFSRGGQVSVFCPTRGQEAWMQQVLEGFGGFLLGMAGLDFLLDEEGTLYFNELEEMAGCRMLYQATDRDLVQDYVDWMADRFARPGG